MFELARQNGDKPLSVTAIAEAQAIPVRFLNLILGELRQAGFVESWRGPHGGYLLAGSAGSITAGDIIRFIDGPVGPVRCTAKGAATDCPLRKGCAFMSMWKRAGQAVAEVYDGTSLQDLIDEQRARENKYVAEYCI